MLKCLKDGFKGDKNKPNILDFSELGLVQMTRRRTSASLDEIRKEICPCCQGSGKVYSNQTMANIIKTNILEEAKRYQTNKLVVYAHKCVLEVIRGHKDEKLKELSERCNREIILRETDSFETEYFKIEPILGDTDPIAEEKEHIKAQFLFQPSWNDNRFREELSE